MKTRMRPARSTTATEMGTLRFAHASMAPSAISRASFQVTSRCICTWALAANGTAQAAITPAAKTVRIDMEFLPFGCDRCGRAMTLPPESAAAMRRKRHLEARVASLELVGHLRDAGQAAS